ncbi:MAG: PAS domain-containing protein [Bacteroidota bacterium]
MGSFSFEKELIPYVKMCEYGPLPLALFEAKTLRLISVNEKMLDLWGRTPAALGAPLLEFMPEIANQRYPDLMRNVGETGKPIQENGAAVVFEKEGKLQQIFLDFSYTPVKIKESHQAQAILVSGTECRYKHFYQQAISVERQNLRAMVLSSPVAMCVYAGEDMQIQFVNEKMLELWEQNKDRQIALLKAVYHTGVMMKKIDNGIEYSCTALRAPEGDIMGCVIIACHIDLKGHITC